MVRTTECAVTIWLIGLAAAAPAKAASADALVRPYPVDSSSNRAAVTLDSPQVIAQAPAEERRWGRFQFPTVKRLRDGRLLVSFSAREDSVKGYSARAEYPNRALSSDEGRTWTLVDKLDGFSGKALPDGSLISFGFKGSRPEAELKLPPPVATRRGNYNEKVAYYRAEDLPAEIRECFTRNILPPGAEKWESAKVAVRIPGHLFASVNGYFAFQTFMQVDTTPWGTLQATLFPACPQLVAGKVEEKLGIKFLESGDQGRSWEIAGTIPYRADPHADPHADKRWSLTEPEFAFAPDGSMVCLIRSTGGAGVGPLYRSHSTDRGRTWSTPEVLDRLGVRPRLLVLANGVTLATYGRPGLYLRASHDPACRQWDAPLTLVAPREKLQDDTCSYASLLATGRDTVLVAYSDFNWPGPDGKPRKTILLRRVTARPQAGAGAR
jgi:hypothetical protein